MFYFDSPIGLLKIESSDVAITKLSWCQDKPNSKQLSASNAYEAQAYEELLRYFDTPKSTFKVAVDLTAGTSFQRRVWKQLTKIKSGQRLTYTELADCVGSHPRPVGNACRANPVPIIIPCHRVVPLRGGIGHYLGGNNFKGCSTKAWLLDYEA